MKLRSQFALLMSLCIGLMIFLNVYVVEAKSKSHHDSPSPTTDPSQVVPLVLPSSDFPNCPPVSSRRVFHLEEFGAVGDNRTLNTHAFRSAIEAIARHGGGELRVGPGIFKTGPFTLTSCMTLNLHRSSSFIQAITDISQWPTITLGSKEQYQDFISGTGVTDVTIMGPGTIDGGGYMWWPPARAGALAYKRGHLVTFYSSQYLTFLGVRLQNSPMFNVQPKKCQHIWVDGLRIHNPADSHNTDGFDPNSCNNVTILNSYFYTGDDAIAVKAGVAPSTNILVRNLTVGAGHCGMCIGSSAKFGAAHVSIVDSYFQSVVNGFCFKGFRGIGGTTYDYSADHIQIDDAKYNAVWLTDEYPGTVEGGSVVPVVYDVRVTNMHATKVGKQPMSLVGLNDSPMSRLYFDNVHIDSYEGGYDCRYVSGTYRNVHPDMRSNQCADMTPA